MFSENLLYAIKNGGLNATTLQSLLVADVSYREALQRLYATPGLLKELLLSDTAMEICFGSEKAGELFVGYERPFYDYVYSNSAGIQSVKHLIRNKYCVQYLFSNNNYHYITRSTTFRDAFKTMFNAAPNDFAVKRQVFTSSGTWTYPGSLSFLAVLCIGAGGNGVAGTDILRYRTGGGGGESECVVATTSLPSSNQTVTIGTATPTTANLQVESTSFGAFCTALGGFNGEASVGSTNTVGSGAGGGTTTGGGRNSCDDTDITNAVVMTRNWAQKGGNGGIFNSGVYTAATQGLVGTAGTGGGSTNATAGGAYGNGGGGNYSTGTGANASANTGSGAGSTYTTDYTGGSGICIVWWVE
jgi:hypothetical protein